ncbi:MAG TPA: hypothetical protein VGN16_19765 [Acidobacteriaceae bacterium]
MGCKSAPGTPASSGNASSSARQPPAPTATYPPRSTDIPPTFKVFHHANGTFTLVIDADSTDDEVNALIWQLRDAAHTHTFDKLKISQKDVDARDPIVWFHIYRGAKCASEKYADGAPPCGASYHAAGDYTFGGYTNKEWDKGVLHHGEDQDILLWDSEAPYAAGAKS